MKDPNNPKEDSGQEPGEAQHLLPDSEASGTAFRQALVEMEAARRYAQNIIEAIREPLLVLDEDLKVLSANRSFYTIFKVNPEETIGSYIYELGSQQWDIPGLRVLLEKILPQNSQFNDFEVEHDFPSIGHKVMMLNARQIHDEVISKRLILLAIEDITGLRKLETERRNTLSMFAHDMRNLLVTSEVFLSRIMSGKAGPLTDKQRDYLEIIRDEVDSFSRLIADFIDFSKFEFHEYTPFISPFNICAEIQKNIKTAEMAAEKKRITISLELPESATFMVNADAAMTSRVVTNLLDNAIKYTDSGGTVSVTVTGTGNEIVVSVRDSGIGIPEDRLSAIFDVFYRGKRDTEGFGLGLSIVKTIVEAHGGRIWVESAPGEGSVFRFTLPKA